MSDEPKITKSPAEAPSPLLLPVVLGGIVGLLVGGLATLFRFILQVLDERRVDLFAALEPMPVFGWLAPMLLVGLALFLAAELVRRFAPEAAGSGIQEIEGTLGGLRPLRWRRILPVKFVGGLLSIGSGAVLGREGPTVQMGGSVGAMVSERFGLSGDGPKILIAAGAAAGLSAAFNAPLAGILFVIEEMRRHFPYRFASLEALAVASVSAAIVARLVTGQAPVITMPAYPAPPIAALWLFPLFGMVVGVFGVIFNRLLLGMLNGVDRLPTMAHRFTPFVVGACLGLVAFLVPDAIGGGYNAIGGALAGQIAGGFLLTLFAIRFAGRDFYAHVGVRDPLGYVLRHRHPGSGADTGACPRRVCGSRHGRVFRCHGSRPADGHRPRCGDDRRFRAASAADP